MKAVTKNGIFSLAKKKKKKKRSINKIRKKEKKKKKKKKKKEMRNNIELMFVMLLENTVELQWLEHLWTHENMFETGSSS